MVRIKILLYRPLPPWTAGGAFSSQLRTNARQLLACPAGAAARGPRPAAPAALAPAESDADITATTAPKSPWLPGMAWNHTGNGAPPAR